VETLPALKAVTNTIFLLLLGRLTLQCRGKDFASTLLSLAVALAGGLPSAAVAVVPVV
jgi:hypothetical protein